MRLHPLSAVGEALFSMDLIWGTEVEFWFYVYLISLVYLTDKIRFQSVTGDQEHSESLDNQSVSQSRVTH